MKYCDARQSWQDCKPHRRTSVVNWGGWLEGPDTVPSGLTGVVVIAAGLFHNLALAPDTDVPVNTAPTVNPGGPYLGAVNTSIKE
jgi:hypothetical protein